MKREVHREPPFRAIAACRICGSTDLAPVLHLGEQALTGIFPKAPAPAEGRAADARDASASAPSPGLTRGPLELVKCAERDGACGLLQLRHSYDPRELYGSQYGYRSSLNRSMVEHLEATVRGLLERCPLGAGDVVLDIGSNDGTALSFYPPTTARIGIDPTAAKFAKYYDPRVTLVPDFFSPDAFFRASGGKKARIVTSIAMFYDLEGPLEFMRHVHDVVADDGIWHFEQSYLPSMLAANSYDTVCHEHLEYYALGTLVWMADRVGFSIDSVSFNQINGGSFAITARKASAGAATHAPVVARILDAERALGLSSLAPFARFAEHTAAHKRELRALLGTLKAGGKRVLGLGASTKGNVILQYCDIGPELVACIGEVNEDKFGCVTPGTAIPIVSEQELFARAPDVLLVLPWHLREDLVARSQSHVARGVRLLFPLPSLDFVPAEPRFP